MVRNILVSMGSVGRQGCGAAVLLMGGMAHISSDDVIWVGVGGCWGLKLVGSVHTHAGGVQKG